jgi:hypothetical protein
MNKQYNINKSYKIAGSTPTPAETRQIFQEAEKKQAQRVNRVKEARDAATKQEREDHKKSQLSQQPQKIILPTIQPVQEDTTTEVVNKQQEDDLDESNTIKEDEKGLMISVNKISKLIKEINSDFDNIVTVLLENPDYYLFKFDFEKCIYYAYNIPILSDFNTSLEVESSKSDKLNLFIKKINQLKSDLELEYKIYVFYDIMTFNYKEIDSEYLYKIKLYNQNLDKTTLFNFIKKEKYLLILVICKCWRL